MPYEIQSKLKLQPALQSGLPGNWRVEFIDMDLDPKKAHFINVDFMDTNCPKEKAEIIVAALLEALNKAFPEEPSSS